MDIPSLEKSIKSFSSKCDNLFLLKEINDSFDEIKPKKKEKLSETVQNIEDTKILWKNSNMNIFTPHNSTSTKDESYFVNKKTEKPKPKPKANITSRSSHFVEK